MKRTIICDASDKDLWLRERAKRITGSDCACMMRISEKFKSYEELVAEKASGDLGIIPDNANMFWGRQLEQTIGNGFAEALRMRWRSCHLLIGHGDGEKLAATLDGVFMPDLRFTNEDILKFASKYDATGKSRFVVEEWMDEFRNKCVRYTQQYGPGVLEIKNTSLFGTSTWNKEIPEYYVPQVQHQLLCTGKRWGAIVGLLGGSNLIGHVYTADEAFQAEIVASADAFWKQVGRTL